MAWWASLTPVDYLYLLILLAAFFQGWRRGLLGQVMRVAAFLVTVIGAGRYSHHMQLWLNERWHLEERLVRWLATRVRLPGEAYLGTAPVTPQQSTEWLKGTPMPGLYRETLAHRLAEWQPGDALANPALLILQQLAAGVASALSYLLLAMAIGIALVLLGHVLSGIIEGVSLLSTANRLAGGLLTAVEAAIAVAVVAALAAPALSLAGTPWLQERLDGATLTPHFLTLFAWLRAVLFGLTTEQFFMV